MRKKPSPPLGTDRPDPKTLYPDPDGSVLRQINELREMTVAQLRDVASGIEGLTGHTQMHKEPLLALICKELGITAHEHHEVVGIDKSAVKARVRELKVERAAALEAHDRPRIKRIRREIHRLKRKLRRATV